MKYQEIDPKFLERYFTMLGNKDRKADKRYKGAICQRDVFVRRTLGKWLKAVGKRRKLVEVVVKSKGRDYKEARKNAAKNNPNLIIHC